MLWDQESLDVFMKKEKIIGHGRKLQNPGGATSETSSSGGKVLWPDDI